MHPDQYVPVYVQPAPPTSGLAVASMISGIFGVLGGCFLCGIPCIVAVILGHMATKETRSGRRGGHGMAITGLILGYLLVVPGLLGAVQLVLGGVLTAFDGGYQPQ